LAIVKVEEEGLCDGVVHVVLEGDVEGHGSISVRRLLDVERDPEFGLELGDVTIASVGRGNKLVRSDDSTPRDDRGFVGHSIVGDLGEKDGKVVAVGGSVEGRGSLDELGSHTSGETRVREGVDLDEIAKADEVRIILVDIESVEELGTVITTLSVADVEEHFKQVTLLSLDGRIVGKLLGSENSRKGHERNTDRDRVTVDRSSPVLESLK